MPGAQLPALAEGERAAWPVRPRTGGVPPLSIRALERRLAPRLCRTPAHVRAEGFTGTPALAEGEKAAWPVRPRTGMPGVQPPARPRTQLGRLCCFHFIVTQAAGFIKR